MSPESLTWLVGMNAIEPSDVPEKSASLHTKDPH